MATITLLLTIGRSYTSSLHISSRYTLGATHDRSFFKRQKRKVFTIQYKITLFRSRRYRCICTDLGRR